MRIQIKKPLTIMLATVLILNALSPLNILKAETLPASFPESTSQEETMETEIEQDIVVPTTFNVSGKKFYDANANANFDDSEYGLEGWQILGAQYVTEVNVEANNMNGINTIPLLSGDYIFLASGTWYGGDDFSQDRFDAEYDSQDNWNTYSNGPILYGEDQGDLLINNQWVNWGEYNTSHMYTTTYNLGSTQSVNFSLFDGFLPEHTKNPEWYQDNNGSLNVKIFRIVAHSFTDASGNYSMDFDINGGQVSIFELMQNGWTQTYPQSYYYTGVSGNSSNLNFGNTIVNDLMPDVDIVPSSTNTVEKSITLTANFTSQGNGPATIVKWDGGNFPGCTGDTSSIMTPSTPGTYTCSVIVKDADGDLAYATETVTVSVKHVTPTNTNKLPKVVLFGNSPANNVGGTVYVLANTNFSITANLAALGDSPYVFDFSGICSGVINTGNSSAVSNGLNLSAGFYVCNVKVKDANGDTTNASVTIVVQNGSTNTNTGSIGTGASTTNTNTETDTDNDGDILGAVSRCVEQNFARGYVFIDANGDGKRQINETGLAGILLTISYEITDQEEGIQERREDVVTDAAGMWEIELCPGTYTIEMNIDQLPDDMELTSDEKFDFDVLENEDKSDVNFVITEIASSGFNFTHFAIILIIIAVLTAGYLLFDRNREEASE